MEKSPSRTLFLLFDPSRTLSIPYFSILNKLKPHTYSILAFSIEQNPAVPYCSIFNRIKLQQYFILAFSMKENPSRTLFLLFEQHNTPAVP